MNNKLTYTLIGIFLILAIGSIFVYAASTFGGTAITGQFNVTGNSTFVGTVTVNGTLNVTKNITMTGGIISYNGTNFLFT